MIKAFYIYSALFFVSTGVLFAQTGPGGVGNSATNVLWLSADNAVFNNAGTTPASNTNDVQQWNDRSGNGENATQSVASYRPNYITNVVNGLPAIRFSAGNDHMMSAGISTANVASVWAVTAYSTLPSPNAGVLLGSPAGTGTNVGAGSKVIGMWVSSGSQPWGRGVQSNATSRDISTATTINASQFYSINNIYRSAATPTINQYINNAASGSNNSHNGTLSSWADITVGRQGNESWNGDIAEVIFYNIEVNTAQRIIVDNYLSAKYGFTLTTNDVYNKDLAGNGNYDFEVAGIGRVDATNTHTTAKGSGIVTMTNPSAMGNDEFLMWGHDNASLLANNTSDVPSGVQARMVRVWRVSEVTAASATVDVGSVDIQWDLTGLGSVTATDLRLIVDTDNDGVFTDETGISGATSLGSNVYQFAGVTAITNNVRFTLGTINRTQTPLPVELVSFYTRLKQTAVEAEWTTASQVNHKVFELERSLNGSDWEYVTSVKSEANSSETKQYAAVDPSPYKEVSYYRLKLIDLDGSYYYSWVSSIDNQFENNKIVVYPNPASGIITVEGELGPASEMLLVNSAGKQINTQSLIKNYTTTKVVLDISSLANGNYVIKTKSGSCKLLKK